IGQYATLYLLGIALGGGVAEQAFIKAQLIVESLPETARRVGGLLHPADIIVLAGIALTARVDFFSQETALAIGYIIASGIFYHEPSIKERLFQARNTPDSL